MIMIPTNDEIDYKLMELLNRCEMKSDIKSVRKYIVKLLKEKELSRQKLISAAVDVKITKLLEITDEFIFPSYYPHTGKVMWKINNVFTKSDDEIIVISPVDEGIGKALDLAIKYISKKSEEYYSTSQ